MKNYCQNLWEKYKACVEAESQTQTVFGEAAKMGGTQEIAISLSSIQESLAQMKTEWEDNFELMDDGRDIFKNDYRQLEEIALVLERPIEAITTRVELKAGRVYSMSLPFPDLASTEMLRKLTAIEALNMSTANTSNLEPLHDLKRLKILVLGFGTTSLEQIRALVNMEDLSFTGNKIKSLEPISDMKKMRSLHANYTEINDLAPLQKLMDIEEIYATATKIKSLEVLRGKDKLRFLQISNTMVTDLGPLSETPALETILFDGTLVVSLEPLTKLHNLKKISFTDAWYFKLPNQKRHIEEIKRNNPGVDIIRV
jgi:hypothetical protein